MAVPVPVPPSLFSPFAPPFMHASEAVFCVPQPFHFLHQHAVGGPAMPLPCISSLCAARDPSKISISSRGARLAYAAAHKIGFFHPASITLPEVLKKPDVRCNACRPFISLESVSVISCTPPNLSHHRLVDDNLHPLLLRLVYSIEFSWLVFEELALT